jgi:hypothetical protein
MKISPEPLGPLRSWRELWQSEHSAHDPALREHAASQTDHWKQQKRPGFQWLNHLFNRKLHK